MNWKDNPQAELIIDLAGRMTENNPGLRNIWVPELVRLLARHYPHERIDTSVVLYALRAGDALSNGNDEPKTSQQRKTYRKRFPS